MRRSWQQPGSPGVPRHKSKNWRAWPYACGVQGFVCSAVEVASLRSRLGSEPLLVIPGIRPEGAATGDQRRVATPGTAIGAGASYLVVGRPITRAADPGAAARSILAEMQAATVTA